MGSAAATSLGFLLLTVNSIMAIHRSWGDGDAMAAVFVVESYAGLVLLFCCLRWLERAPPGSAAEERARTGVSLTTMFLTAMISCGVVPVMPGLMAAAVWLIVR